MAVFVNGLFRGPGFGRWAMFADTEAELHAMADRIGIGRRWFRGNHYSVCRSKRARALAAGAVELTQLQLGAMISLRALGQPMGEPGTAISRLSTALLDPKRRLH